MDQADRSRKRQRMDEGIAPEVVHRSRHLYFSDGNIIIKTSLTPDAPSTLYELTGDDNGPSSGPALPEAASTVDNASAASLVYKVHKGILANHCSAFSSIFSGPQTVFDGASESYDGTPVMALPDTWQDVEEFLLAMYRPEYMSGYLEDKSRVDAARMEASFLVLLSRVLRMAKKYDASTIHSIAARHLKKQWPSQLSFWESKVLWDAKYPDPALAVRVSIDHDIPQILPVALYQLCVQFEAYDHIGNDNIPQMRRESAVSPARRIDLSVLDAGDWQMLFLGRASLYAQYDKHLTELCSLQPPACTKRGHCSTVLKTCLHPHPIYGSSLYFERKCTMFGFLNQVASEFPMYGDICSCCRRELVKGIQSAKTSLWKDLPKIFNLGTQVPEGWGTE